MNNWIGLALFLLGFGLGGLWSLNSMKKSFDDYVEVSEKGYEDMNKIHEEYEELLKNRITYLDKLVESKEEVQ